MSRGNLVFCATGNRCISGDDVEKLNNGSYIISVTSSDDEVDLEYTRAHYNVEQVSSHIERFDSPGHFFYVVSEGNAVNLSINDPGRLGPFIYPVQAALFCAVKLLANGQNIQKKVTDIPQDVQRHIADCWENAFATVNSY